MPQPTVAPLATGRASPAPPRLRLTVAPVHHEPAVPLYTRHTRGTIEAERDRRLRSHAGLTLRHVRRPAMPHPRIAAALAARTRIASQARADVNRWVDEGGWFDPEAVDRLRIGNREMKRCSS